MFTLIWYHCQVSWSNSSKYPEIYTLEIFLYHHSKYLLTLLFGKQYWNLPIVLILIWYHSQVSWSNSSEYPEIITLEILLYHHSIYCLCHFVSTETSLSCYSHWYDVITRSHDATAQSIPRLISRYSFPSLLSVEFEILQTQNSPYHIPVDTISLLGSAKAQGQDTKNTHSWG